MPQKQFFSQDPFLSLPVEIRHAILCEMSDVGALDTAIKADSSLQSVFLGSVSCILDRVLQNSVSAKHFPEILAIQASAHFDRKTWSRDKVSTIIDSYFQRQQASPIQWTLPDALYLNDLNRHIQYFVDEFATTTLSVHPASSEPFTYTPLSPVERCRIAGAFYRFELYCNLFREYGHGYKTASEPFSADEQKDIFLARFSPWEIEQLGCIHDYLVEKITPGFVDMAEHDVEWGKLTVPYDIEYVLELQPYLSNTLSLGLADIHRLVIATNYEERHQLLSGHETGIYNFLWDAMWIRRDNECDRCVYQKGKSSTDDPDPGPYNAWYWAHKDATDQDFAYTEEDKSLRRRGYVM
ncbi:hypothetical protein AJ79_09811 [Helicocarpus griseus UAMH5409]|uniref:Uncharacterized protein n=1 Tax=Helicocarpus griseus UAMH5409 TaxID=1447875 RepID=A0A2B7W8R5_9EURO|nr:hypothetical protein AJ79_09811 [Helicocarpus griseus UAMH5409]